MSDSFPYADLVVLGLVAGFVLLRLRSILGQNTGFDGTPAVPPATVQKPQDELLAQLTNRLKNTKQDVSAKDELEGFELSAAQKSAIADIKKSDASFTLTEFMVGARAAFEMVFDAYLKADKNTLEHLLAPELAASFVDEANKRTQGDRMTETTLVAVESMTVKDIQFNAPVVRVTLNILSEQVTVVRDKQGVIVEGDPSHIERVEDEWTFERSITSKSPNWMIVDT